MVLVRDGQAVVVVVTPAKPSALEAWAARDLAEYLGKICGAAVPVAFAVWDGSAGDRDGKKSVTIWQDLKLAP